MSYQSNPEEQKAILQDIMEQNKKRLLQRQPVSNLVNQYSTGPQPRERPSPKPVAPPLPTRPGAKVFIRPPTVQVVRQSTSFIQYSFTDEANQLPDYQSDDLPSIQPDFGRSHAQEPLSPWFSLPNRPPADIPTRPSGTWVQRNHDDSPNDDHLMSGARLLSHLLASERKEHINGRLGFMSNEEYKQAMQDALEASFRASRPRNNKAKQQTIQNIVQSQITATKKFCDLKHTCTVCLSDFEENDKVITTPCGHMFHLDCMKNAMDRDNRCPNCRTNLDKD